MSTDVVTIKLPLPPKELSPNARVHYMAKARKVKEYRTHVAETVMYVERVGFPRWPSAEVQATFYHARNQRRDKDNLLSSLKAAFDGLVDGGLLSDDSGITHLPVQTKIDKADPRVEIVVRKIA